MGEHTGILHVSPLLYHPVLKGRFTNVDLNPSCPARRNFVWTHLQGRETQGYFMVAMEATVQALISWSTTGNQISRSTKVDHCYT